MRLGNWETVEELGHGGQGTAYLALDARVVAVDALVERFRTAVATMGTIQTGEDHRRNGLQVLELIDQYVGRESPRACGALKLLHEAARKDSKALVRLATEVDVLRSIDHPNLLPIRDSAVQQGWYVTPFYRRGSLAKNLGAFTGQPERALSMFRRLVDGVALLHDRQVVHRDIKPENLFLADHGLVLGDFGIVWFEDAARVSETYENVGSRDWMPGWAQECGSTT